MGVHTFELFHGVALTKLVRSEKPVSLRLIEANQAEAWAEYTINAEVALLIKHVTIWRRHKREECISWQFVFSPSEVRRLHDLREKRDVRVALVCGDRSLDVQQMAVCLLEPADLDALLDLSAEATQSVTVKLYPRKSLRAQSARGMRVIPRNRLDTWELPGA